MLNKFHPPAKPWQRPRPREARPPMHSSRGRKSSSPNTERIYAAIVAYASEHSGNTPKIRELMELCEISSTSVVAYHIQFLIDAGKLEWRDKKLIVIGGVWIPPESAGAA